MVNDRRVSLSLSGQELPIAFIFREQGLRVHSVVGLIPLVDPCIWVWILSLGEGSDTNISVPPRHTHNPKK